MSKVRPMSPEDREALVELIAQFRITMSRCQGRARASDPEAAEAELDGYVMPEYHVFVSEGEDSLLSGYLVCRIKEDKVWAESLYVCPENRRQGVGSALFAEAERLAEEFGDDTVHNRLRPNNDRMISFLRRQGYSVLTEIELRKARPGEENLPRIKLGLNTFEYCC